MKKVLPLIFILMTQLIVAQEEGFEKQWQRMDSLELQGRISTASELSQKITAAARKEKDFANLIKARIFFYKFYQITNEDSNAFILADINKTLAQLPVPFKNVLQSYKASFLKQYYDQHRWSIQDRTRIDDPDPTDLETWSVAILRDSIRLTYEGSLESAATLGSTPTELIDELVLASPLGRKYRPSLYDLLAYRALEYFTDQSNFPKVRPEQEYAFTNEKLYAETEDFLKIDLKTATPTSASKVLQSFQQLEELHRKSENSDPLVYAQLERLEYVNENFRGTVKWNLYTEALERLAQEYKAKPVSALILLAQAANLKERAEELDEEGKLQNPDFLKKAVELCDQIIREFPNSESFQNAHRLKEAILQVSINSKIPEYLPACQPGRILISYKNADSLRLQIFRIPHRAEKYIPYYKRDSIVARILEKESVADRQLELPQAGDHNEHSTEFVLEELEKGSYFVHLSGRATAEKEGYSYAFLEVTDLVFTETNLDEHSLYKVLDRSTGEVVPGARLQFYNDEKLLTDAQTNARGIVKVASRKNFSTGRVLVTKEGDSLSSFYSNYRSSRDAKEQPMAKTMLYLDRHIYRPGQTVYFKGVLLKRENSKTSTVPGEFTEVVAEDANGEEIFRKRLQSNKYGSFSGEFTLPKVGITGIFSIYTEEDSDADSPFWNLMLDEGEFLEQRVRFSVEEYKRPTFEVSFDDNNRTFQFGDTVQLSGKVESFMGSPINSAKLVYTVERQKMVYSWWRPYFEEVVTIKTDTLTTDAQGRFTIEFPAEISRKDLSDEELIYNYNIKATVTDISGETREGSSSLKLGKKNLLLELQMPENLTRQDSLDISLSATNLNDQPVPVQGTLKIYKLKAPDRILRDRLWEAPEIQTIPEDIFIELFPEEPYGAPLQPLEWPKGELVYQSGFSDTAPVEKKLFLPRDWESGKYIVEVFASNDASTAEISKSFNLIDPQDLYLPDNQRFSASLQNSNFLEEGEVQLLLQTAYTDLNVQVLLYDQFTPLFDTIVNIDGRKEFVIPLKGVTAKAVEIQVHGVKNNSLIETKIQVPLERPERSLKIETETFRNKIQPGTEETWSFRISDPEGGIPDAEILATMYDASLDQFQRPYVSSDWQLDPGFVRDHLFFPSFSSSTIGGIIHLDSEFPFHRGYRKDERRLDTLRFFGFDFSNPHSWAYRSYLRELKMTYNKVIEVVVAEVADEVELQETAFMMKAPPPPPSPEIIELSGKVSGLNVEQNALGSQQIIIRGYSSATGDTPLFIIDGEIVTEHQLNASDILSTDVLTPSAAMALYGARASNGAVIITTRQGLQDLQQVEARKDLDETAFFFPHLTLDPDGSVKFSFTSPEALTQWKLRLLAHTSSWTTGSLEEKVVTQKELSVTPNAPRFLREGDSIVFKTRITNMSSEAMTGTAILQLFDAVSMEPIDELLLTSGKANDLKSFQIAPNNSTAVSWQLHIPQGVQAVTYRILAKAGNFSDGEENLLPVLSNRMLVSESLPMFVRAGETETYSFENLKNNDSNTLEHHKFSIEYTANPAWYAIQSLPYLMEFEHECSEQIFSRIYANSLAAHVVNSQPKIREVFEKWRRDSTLVSPLEKNEELKSLILAETPWLRDAVSEEEQKQRLGELFKLEKLSGELEENLDRLASMQLSSGAFPWFSGGDENYFITRHILAGFGHLEKLGVDLEGETGIIEEALEFLDNELLEEEKRRRNDDLSFYETTSNLHYLYARSFFMEEFPPNKEVKQLIEKILAAQKENWLQKSLYSKALLLTLLPRFNEDALAEQILVSLKESAVRSEDYGMYWKDNTPGWFWYRAPIETQALLIEGFSEVGTAPEAVEEMKIWLLQNKRSSHWPTTKSTTEAVYALLLQGEDWLQLEDETLIQVGGEPLPPERLAETEKEAGTGYIKLTWKGEEVREAFSEIRIVNNNEVPGYGGAYWQYFEDLDKIKSHSGSPLNIEKELYLNVSGASGTTLKQITPETQLKPGDLITVRLLVRSTAEMDYIHLKDMRASGFEPTNVMSEYKYQDGTAYYESTRDAATHFFFDRLRKGTYVLEYTVRANNAGNFSNGITTIESMYAPEFSGHTKGIRVNIGG